PGVRPRTGRQHENPSCTALLRTRRRRPGHEFRGEMDDWWRLGALADLREQDLRAAPAGGEQLLAHGRQTDVVRRLDVVIADHREILGNLDAELPGSSDDTEGLGIAGREDRGRARASGEHRSGEITGLVASVRPMTHPVRRDHDASLDEPITQADLSVAA